LRRGESKGYLARCRVDGTLDVNELLERNNQYRAPILIGGSSYKPCYWRDAIKSEWSPVMGDIC